jgi:hypothetical protein
MRQGKGCKGEMCCVRYNRVSGYLPTCSDCTSTFRLAGVSLTDKMKQDIGGGGGMALLIEFADLRFRSNGRKMSIRLILTMSTTCTPISLR